jgi:hypothetical protein
MITKLYSAITIAALGTALSFAATSAQADFITNGNFTNFTYNSGAGGSSAGGQVGYNATATGWTTSGYNFLFAGGSADTTGVNGQYGNLQLWGSHNGGVNALVPSPAGGNYIGADGAFNVGAIQQTITGLTAGAQYTVGFYWAAAQQYGFDGATTEKWQVSLGGQTQYTSILNDVSHGFTGWQYSTMTFTADGSSDVLSFLANGTPSGVPPFALLDGITMSQTVPEPASAAMLLTGLAGLGGIMRRRRKAAKAATE